MFESSQCKPCSSISRFIPVFPSPRSLWAVLDGNDCPGLVAGHHDGIHEEAADAAIAICLRMDVHEYEMPKRGRGRTVPSEVEQSRHRVTHGLAFQRHVNFEQSLSLQKWRGLLGIGRLEPSPGAVTNRKHSDRLWTLIDLVDNPVNVRLLAVEQVPQFPLSLRASGATGQRSG
jgi:hypothetical protein